MARHNITIGLSPKSIDIAIKELRKYKEYLRKKTDELVKALSVVPKYDENSKKIISEVENSETVAANFLPQKGKFLCEKE